MNRLFCTAGLFLSLMTAAYSQAHAVSLAFAPATSTVQLGNQVTVDIIVTDLANEFVGEYDFFVNWDQNLLSLSSLTFGNFLGGSSNSLQSSDDSIPGELNIAEVALGTLSLQDGFNDFGIATLVFDTISAGVSTLGFTGNIGNDPSAFLGDELGSLLTTTAGTGEITITSAVNEPSIMALLALGVLGTLTETNRRKRRALEKSLVS